MNDQLAALFAKRFIQRRDVKAVQFSSGAFVPDRELKRRGTDTKDPGVHGPLGWEMQHLTAHLEGTATYGHYVTDQEDKARCFTLDIDLQKEGFWCSMPTDGSDPQAFACNPREVWLDRNPDTAIPEARQWFKTQMGTIGRRLVRVIHEQLGIGSAVAYSGAKGIHVYGFTGPMSAAEVRDGALFVLDYTDEWKPLKGEHFFTHKVEDPFLGYQNFSIEVFPKQGSLEGKDLGNLVRLPLGRNLKSQDPTFFVDLQTPIGEMAPHPDPVFLLETGDSYAIR